MNENKETKPKSLQEIFPQIEIVPLPTSEQTIDIVKRFQEGNTTAEKELKFYYMRFVASMAKQYLNKGLTKEELLNAGTKGLLLAGKRFDPSRKMKFISYAVWYIRHNIEQEL